MENDDDNNFSSSLETYILTDMDYILKRTVNNKIEYFYCNTKRSKDNSDTVKTIRGNINSNGIILFERENFHFEVRIDDLGKFEHRKLC